jgi:hypothetical protein
MKKILLSLFVMFGLAASFVARSQSFTMQYANDTVYTSIATSAAPADYIKNLTGGNITVRWHVLGTDASFPSDWLTAAAFGICDNFTCRGNTSNSLWNASTGIGGMFYSTYYSNATHDSAASFSLSLDFSSVASFGTHWIKVNIKDTASGDQRTVTFIINKIPTAVPAVNNMVTEVTLYPNPAHSELNAVYDASADIKTIAVYNVIGKAMMVYRVNNTSANLNIENLPSGVYFVRMVNSEGNVVATKKFNKQ